MVCGVSVVSVCRYEEFHSVVLGEVGVWSAGVEGCVCEYDTALCRYLGVARAPPNAGGKVRVCVCGGEGVEGSHLLIHCRRTETKEGAELRQAASCPRRPHPLPSPAHPV